MKTPKDDGRRGLYLTGPLLLVAGLGLNGCLLAWAVHRGETFSLPTMLGIGAFDLLLVGTGCLFIRYRVRIPAGIVLGNLVGLAAVLAAAELAVVLALKGTVPTPGGRALELVRHLYLQERNVIQFSPDCGRHDPRLGYTLKPGACTFRNAEFATRVAVNRLGLRDDETSLEAPRIIVLGDSHAMGWGVEGHETFAEVIARETGAEVLNAAISSYGTARELLTLERLDASRLEALILQYSSNDFDENRTFLVNGAELPVMSEQEYSKLVKRQERKQQVRFGTRIPGLIRKHLVDPLLRGAAGFVTAGPAETPDQEPESDPDKAEAEAFLDVLDAFSNYLPPVPVLVIEINGYGANDSGFIDALRTILGSRQPGRDLELLDASSFLTPEHYLRLDDHLTARGHQLVAQALLDRLEVRRGR